MGIMRTLYLKTITETIMKKVRPQLPKQVNWIQDGDYLMDYYAGKFDRFEPLNKYKKMSRKMNPLLKK